MATRLYLSASQLPGGDITPGFAAWDRTTEGDRRAMTVAKDGSALASKAFWGSATAAANTTALCRQFISPPMAAGVGFTTSDTFKMVARVRESAANDNINRTQICVKVYSEDGTTLQATLYGLAQAGPSSTEWPTSLTNRQFANGDALTSGYTTVAGDRLVIEVGGQVSGTGGTTVTGNINFGSAPATDCAENDTSTTANCPWFEISRDITFLAPPDNGDEAPWGLAQITQQVQSGLQGAALGMAALALAVGTGWGVEMLPIPPAEGAQSLTPTPVAMVVEEQAPVVPVPWYWHQDTLYVAPPTPVEDDAAAPVLPVPWVYQVPDPWRFDQPERLPMLSEDGYAPPLPSAWPWVQQATGGGHPVHDGSAPPTIRTDEGTWPVPVVVPWQATVYEPAPQPEYPTPPPTLAGDEGAVVFGIQTGGWDLVPPPSGGFGPPFTPTELAGEDPPYLPSAPVAWLVTAYLPPEQGEQAFLWAEDDPYQPDVRAPWSATWLAFPNQDEYPTAPPPALPGEDEPVLPTLLAPWAVQTLPAWLGQDDWVPPPAGSITADEGAVLFGVRLGGWELVPPPSGGFGPPYSPVGPGVEDDPYLPFLRPLAPFYDPTLILAVGDDLAQMVDEGVYVPGPPIWTWQRPLPVLYTPDEWPSGVTPSLFGQEDYTILPGLAPWLARQPWSLLWPADQFPAPVASIFGREDGWASPMPSGWAWQHVPVVGGHPVHDGSAPPTLAVDEGTWPVPMPLLGRALVLPFPWPGEEWPTPVTPFWTDEDLDPDLRLWMLPPLWRPVRTPFDLWDVDEARVTFVPAGGAQGTGRTHLFLGQVDPSPTPAAAAGELYVLSGGYGAQAGDATLLTLETPDVAPLGLAGRVRFRRFALPCQVEAACTLRVTPIVDYTTELPAVTVAYPAPGERTRVVVQGKVLATCTVLRLRIEVLDAEGPVEVYRPSLYFTPLTGGSTMALGGAP